MGMFYDELKAAIQDAKDAGSAAWYTAMVDQRAQVLCAHLDRMFGFHNLEDVNIEVDDNSSHFTIMVRDYAYDTVEYIPDWVCVLDYLSKFAIKGGEDGFTFVFTV